MFDKKQSYGFHQEMQSNMRLGLAFLEQLLKKNGQDREIFFMNFKNQFEDCEVEYRFIESNEDLTEDEELLQSMYDTEQKHTDEGLRALIFSKLKETIANDTIKTPTLFESKMITINVEDINSNNIDIGLIFYSETHPDIDDTPGYVYVIKDKKLRQSIITIDLEIYKEEVESFILLCCLNDMVIIPYLRSKIEQIIIEWVDQMDFTEFKNLQMIYLLDDEGYPHIKL